MPIMKTSDTELHIKKGQLLARGPLAIMADDQSDEIEETKQKLQNQIDFYQKQSIFDIVQRLQKKSEKVEV